MLHPIIQALIQERIAQAKSAYCILVSPLLLETSQADLVDRILVVDLPEDLQLERAASRDGSDKAAIQAIMNTQSSRELRLSRADDVLDNSLPAGTLLDRVKTLHERYLQLTTS